MKLGSAFSDSLSTGDYQRSRKLDTETPWWAGNGRALLFATLLFIGFFIILWRLFDLSLVHGLEYKKLSDGNRTRELVRHAPRGILLDRTGKPLVINTPQYRLIAPCEGKESQTCVTYISQSEGDALAKTELPAGKYLEVDYLRTYPYGDALAHAIGYTGELSGEELASEHYKLRNYTLGDRVGRMGAEEVYNERLRGRDGKELMEVNADGKALRVLGRQEELGGENITLAFDAVLARVAAQAFPPGEKGAIVVSKPATGEVLALYSSPGFSPDAFSLGMSTQEYTSLMNNPDLPMFDRVIGGVYPPGSTFKIVTAMAGLEGKFVDRNTIVEDNGVITIGPFTFPNWYFLQYGKTEGPVDIIKALARSNDIYFYKLGEWTGISNFVEWAHKVGIGAPLGIELSGEVGGLMPDPAWKASHFSTDADREARNDQWYLGDTYHISIGQGYLLTTPLQVNAWTNAIANDGKLCVPTIEKITTGFRAKSPNCKNLSVKKETLSLITEGMRQACATGGTGWPLFDFRIQKSEVPQDSEWATQSATVKKSISVPIACKTGTAEFGDPKNHTHAWFTAFGPIPENYIPDDVKATGSYVAGEPEISVTVLVEGAGEGSSVAGPVAKKILEEWFGR
jgi:penicillin-binding protein 2